MLSSRKSKGDSSWPGRWIVALPDIKYRLEAMAFLHEFSNVIQTDQMVRNIGDSSVQISFIEEDHLSSAISFSTSRELRIPARFLLNRSIEEIRNLISSIDFHSFSSTLSMHDHPISLIQHKKKSLEGVFLVLMNPKDTRWKTAPVPPNAFVLINSARRAGHHIRIIWITDELPDRSVFQNTDFIAMTLYEDHFEKTQELLSNLRRITPALIIAGGPMVTLSPEVVAFHLPEVNVFVRGEADSSFPILLDVLSNLGRLNGTSPEKMQLFCSLDGICVFFDRYMVFSNYDRITYLDNFDGPHWDLAAFERDNFKMGLELTTSRGCSSHCFFCSRIHGSVHRKMSISKLKRNIENYVAWIAEDPAFRVRYPDAMTVNIDDDDILVDIEWTNEVMNVLQSNGLKFWGIQTSLGSLADDDRRRTLLERLSDGELYPGNRPLFWIGTDAFSDTRLKNLGKTGSVEILQKICRDLRDYHILDYHYWIVTDAESDWEIFFDELILMRKLSRQNPSGFRVMPNAATLIPYPSAAIFKMRKKNNLSGRIEYKKTLKNERFSQFDYGLVMHERPESSYLYALVEPRAKVPERLMMDARSFLAEIRTGEFDKALFRALRAIRLEMEDPNVGSSRKKRLESIYETCCERPDSNHL